MIDYDNGKMDGFDLNSAMPGPNLLAYTYINPNQIKPYYAMAQQYVLADDFFTSHIDASFTAHQYIIAGQAGGAVNLPTHAWGCEGLPNDFVPTLRSDRSVGASESPCFTYKTLGDELDAAGLSWRFYAPHIQDPGGSWSSFQAVNEVFNGPEWKTNVISPETTILDDVPHGTLANVTWVVPNNNNSDHPWFSAAYDRAIFGLARS